MLDRFKKNKNVFYPLVTAACILLLWYIAAKATGSSIILPEPKEAFSKLGNLLSSKKFWVAVSGTFWRAVRSFIYAVIFATLLAIISHLIPTLKNLLDPFITVLRAVPTMSIILLTLIWLPSTKSPMLISFLITFPMLYGEFLSALDSVDGKLVQMSKVFKVKKIDMLKGLFLPQIAPAAFSGMKNAISLSVKVTIASEVMAQTVKSMGVYMQQTMIYFETAELMAWTIAAVVLGYFSELIIVLIKRAVVRW